MVFFFLLVSLAPSPSKFFNIDLDEKVDSETLTNLVDIGFVASIPGDIERRWKKFCWDLDGKVALYQYTRKKENDAQILAKEDNMSRCTLLWLVSVVSEFYL
jgi:hypothetical protein